MSAVLTPPNLPAGRFGGLLRAETHRFGARRFIRVLFLLAGLGWVTALVLGLIGFASPTPEALAAAEAQRQQSIEFATESREQCLGSVPTGESADSWCGPPVRAEDFPRSWFLDPAPFSLAEHGTSGAVAFAAAASVLAFLVAATFVGAEWSTRSMVALLFWETRRPRVLGAKIAVVAAASLAIGVVAQLAWLAMAGIWQAVAGDGVPLPEGSWPDLLATQGRAVLLIVCAGLLGFGATNLVRNTGATLGTGFVYSAVVETAVRALRPAWQPWLLTNNATALVLPDGLTLYTGSGESTGPDQYLLGNAQAGVFMVAVTVVVLAAGIALFSRRDLH